MAQMASVNFHDSRLVSNRRCPICSLLLPGIQQCIRHLCQVHTMTWIFHSVALLPMIVLRPSGPMMASTPISIGSIEVVLDSLLPTLQNQLELQQPKIHWNQQHRGLLSRISYHLTLTTVFSMPFALSWELMKPSKENKQLEKFLMFQTG